MNLTEALKNAGFGHRKSCIEGKQEVFALADGESVGLYDAAEGWELFTKSGELKRVRQDGKYWVLEIYSIPGKRWIVQGEHLSREDATADLKGW